MLLSASKAVSTVAALASTLMRPVVCLAHEGHHVTGGGQQATRQDECELGWVGGWRRGGLRGVRGAQVTVGLRGGEGEREEAG